MYVRGKRLQKGSTHSSSALQQRRIDGRRHTRETTETGACDYTGKSWKGRRNEKGGVRFFLGFNMYLFLAQCEQVYLLLALDHNTTWYIFLWISPYYLNLVWNDRFVLKASIDSS